MRASRSVHVFRSQRRIELFRKFQPYRSFGDNDIVMRSCLGRHILNNGDAIFARIDSVLFFVIASSLL